MYYYGFSVLFGILVYYIYRVYKQYFSFITFPVAKMICKILCLRLRKRTLNFFGCDKPSNPIRTFITYKGKIPILCYTFLGKLWKLPLFSVENRKIIAAFDENDNDILTDILPFAGPNNNFHGIQLLPSFWGKSQITLHYEDGEQRDFTECQNLC